MVTASTGPAHPDDVIFFDGVCNLCAAAVHFVIARDHAAVFRFASLQSELGVAVVGAEPRSICFRENGRLFFESTAALRIARRLDGAWKLAYMLIIVPRPIRDGVYRFIARNRYRWFGRKDVCLVPSPALQKRFLT